MKCIQTFLITKLVRASSQIEEPSPLKEPGSLLETVLLFQTSNVKSRRLLSDDIWRSVFTDGILKSEEFTDMDKLSITNQILMSKGMKLRIAPDYKIEEGVPHYKIKKGVPHYKIEEGMSNLIDSALYELIVTGFLKKELLLKTPYKNLTNESKSTYHCCSFLKVLIPTPLNPNVRCTSNMLALNIIDDFHKLGLKGDMLIKIHDSLDLVFKALKTMGASLLPYIERKKEVIIKKSKTQRFNIRETSSKILTCETVIENIETNLTNLLNGEYLTNCRPALQKLYFSYYILLAMELKRNNHMMPQKTNNQFIATWGNIRTLSMIAKMFHTCPRIINTQHFFCSALLFNDILNV